MYSRLQTANLQICYFKLMQILVTSSCSSRSSPLQLFSIISWCDIFSMVSDSLFVLCRSCEALDVIWRKFEGTNGFSWLPRLLFTSSLSDSKLRNCMCMSACSIILLCASDWLCIQTFHRTANSCLAVLWVLLRFSSRASVTILYFSPVEKIGSLTHNNLGHWLRLDTCPQNSQFVFERKHLVFTILSPLLLPSLPSPIPLKKKQQKKRRAAVLVKCLAPKRIHLLNAAFVETMVEIFVLGHVLSLCCI